MKFLVLYFIIAFVLSVVGTYYDYRSSYFHKSIESYFNDNFKLSVCICIWVFWPITLIVLFFMTCIPYVYMAAVMLLDKIFGGKKK